MVTNRTSIPSSTQRPTRWRGERETGTIRDVGAKSTIRDVARLAGVSVTTVSRVLNEPDTVRAVKVAAVRQAIEQLQYQPNRVARSLKSKTFAVIALVVTDISNMFFAEIAKVFESQCDERGYSLMLCNIDTREDRLVRLLRELPQRGVDGIIVCGSAHMTSPQVHASLREILEHGPPLVATGHEVDGLPFVSVTNDSQAGIDQVVAHLQETGRSRIAYLSGPAHSQIVEERRLSFRAAARERGFVLDERLTLEIGYDFDAGQRAVERLLAVESSFDAIVCAGDQMAIGAIRGLKVAGLRVPEDVAVIGFDNTRLAEFSEPPLSSVSVNLQDIATLATDRLFGLIGGSAVETRTVVPTQLLVRASS